MTSGAGDFRLAWRGLLRARTLAAAAILTLAVGIAGTLLGFGLVNGILLRPLAVLDQDRVVVAWTEIRSRGVGHWPFVAREVDVIRTSSRLLAEVAGVGYNGAGREILLENESASYVNVAPVTGDFFDVLGVRPALGRGMTRADDVTGAERVLVLTYGLWSRRYGRSADTIGRHVVLAGQPFTIVGVMPPEAEYPPGVEAWASVSGLTTTLANPAFQIDLDLVARVHSGATVAQAADELRALVTRLDAEAAAGSPTGRTPVVWPIARAIVGDVQTRILMLFAVVALVLVIASTNVANLLLLRGEERRRERAVCAALGAGRWQLARPAIVESLMLGGIAGALGLLGASWLLHVVPALVPGGLPRVESIRIDGRVLAFSVAVACVAAMLAGAAPALLAASTDPAAELRGGARETGRRGGRALVIVQVALALTVVAAAGLLAESLRRLQAVDMGLASDRIVFVDLDIPHAKYRDQNRLLQFLDAAILHLTDGRQVAAATPIEVKPFSGARGWDLSEFTAEGQSVDDAQANPSLNLESVRAGYFETFELPLVRGRAFTSADRAGTPLVAVVSEDVAARTWPGLDPIGKRIKFGRPGSTAPWRQVVGVVRPNRYRDLIAPRPTLYLPAEQFIVSANALALRTTAPPSQVESLVRDRLQAIDPDVHVMRALSFTDLLAGPLARPRFSTALVAAFAGVALLLAAVGLYAIVSAFVGQRAGEIGVRVALGATPNDIRGLVAGEAFKLTAIGLACGLALSFAMARGLRTLLFEVAPFDPVTIASATIVLLAVAAAASYLPIRRAARTDPMILLKTL